MTAGGPDSTFSAKIVGRNGAIQVASIGRSPRKTKRSESSLDAMEEEIRIQIDDLPKIATDLARLDDYRGLEPSEIVFTGSGDSFASSLFAHYFSGELAQAADPYELLLEPDLTERKTVFINSISGKTKANLQLASRVRHQAKKRVAVTANPNSPLARVCDNVVQLAYRTPGILTAGTISFTASLLALASFVRQLPSLNGLNEMESRAIQWVGRHRTIPERGYLFVGSGTGFALSAYAAFKVHEVLGESADYQHTEQLGHSRLFALSKRENIVCFAAHKDGKTRDVFKALVKNGFRAHLMASEADDPIFAGLEAAFAFQHLALHEARRRGQRECAFLVDSNRLAMSSKLIY